MSRSPFERWVLLLLEALNSFERAGENSPGSDQPEVPKLRREVLMPHEQ